MPPGTQGGAWPEQILYSFPGYADGGNPVGALALGGDGTIYGALNTGGAVPQLGAIFQLAPPATPGGAWTEAILYGFEDEDGGSPNGVVLGPGGVLYGSNRGLNSVRQCLNGGVPCGTVFQLTPPEQPGGPWTETILHTFMGSLNGDGAQPSSTPVLGPGGVLYGTTGAGGGGGFVGTIYEMVPPSSPGGAWTEVILYSFPASGVDGETPNAVTLGPDGNLYGTALAGGVHNLGTVFQLVLQ